VPPVELVENNKRINLEPGKYLTDEITSHAISYINESVNKPFFLYLAYNAPHWPLQAPAEDIAKYKGRYAIGWDSLRKERLAKQISLGIADPKQTIAKPDPEITDWQSLTYDEQQLWQRKMEVYAAMVDRVDQNLARILSELKRLKKDDNTLIVLISDNGAQGGFIPTGRKRPRSSGPIGSAGSYDYQEQNWVYVSNTPFRNYKATPYEGGISAPFVAWFPKKIKAGTVAKGTGHLIDLAPTFYDLAAAKYPETFNGVKTNPLPGVSLTNLLFQGIELPADRAIFWDRAGNRAVRKGKWKVVSIFPQNQWQLFDLETDRGETTDLAAQHPDVVKALNTEYEAWAKRTDVEPYEKLRPVVQGNTGPNAGGSAQPRPGARVE
jgi:arylsulfatase A-like enzyme